MENKFDRERSQLEDKFDWSTGLQLIENYANELKVLKMHYEKLKRL